MDHPNTCVQKHEVQPLLKNAPYFHFIASKSHVLQYHLVVPARMREHLPELVIPVVLSCRNREWKMNYLGGYAHKQFDSGWKKFVVDNNIKLGDGCFFELTECSDSGAKFRVQILDGELSPEIANKISGTTSDAPILID